MTTGSRSVEDPRPFCVKCRRPASACLCPTEPPLETDTRIVILMHFKEARRTKCGTGRIAHLNLANSELIEGIAFDDNVHVKTLLDDPRYFCVLVYPGGMTIGEAPDGLTKKNLDGRTLAAFFIDSTWSCSRSCLRTSPRIASLPKVSITPKTPSRFVIKKQPAALCLSTLEAIHELLLELTDAGMDRYDNTTRLLEAFAKMQDYQIDKMERYRSIRHPRRETREGKILGKETRAERNSK